jgi:hypothetical protein
MLTDIKRFTSPKRTFKYPTIAATAKGFPLNSADKIGKISNITTRSGAVMAATYAFVGAGVACRSAGTLNLTTTTGSVYLDKITPQSLAGRGPKSIDITMKAKFYTQHGVPQGGNIALTLQSDWAATTSTACTISGLTNESTANVVKCTRTGLVFTITQFSDFSGDATVTFEYTITKLLPPLNTGATTNKELISTLTTSDGTNTIDTYTNTAADDISVTIAAADGVSTIQTIATYPPNSGLINVDLYLQFSLTSTIPVGGIITLSLPFEINLSDGHINNICWLNSVKYSECKHTIS